MNIGHPGIRAKFSRFWPRIFSPVHANGKFVNPVEIPPPQHSKMIVILIVFNASRINRNVKQLIIRDLVLSRGFNTPDELFVI